MLSFTLASGRRITLLGFHCERVVAFDSRAVERSLRLAALLHPGVPVHVIERDPLPWHACVGLFTSDAIGPEPAGGANSYLTVCWFVPHVERNVREIVEPAARGLDWESLAADHPIW